MTSDNPIIEMSGESEEAKNLVAKLPKDQLRSLFYLFAGKPDSRIKIFEKPLYLEVKDIIELNECIIRKLETHNIEGQITTVTAGYKGADIQEFGSWAEFTSHHWQEPERVEEIVIKWDFMVKLPRYEIPQRHTLLLRVSSDMKPGKFLQLMASGNSDDFDQFDMLTAPAFCRVDFINAQISKELVNEVSSWVESRKEPALIPDTYYWFKKNRQQVAELIHHSIPFTFCLVWIAMLLWAITNKFDGSIRVEHAAIWLFSGLYLFTPSGKLGHVFAKRVFSSLKSLDGSKVTFEFTSGDRKYNAELIDKNKRQGTKFVRESLWSLLLNIAAGLIATYLYLHS